MATTLAGVQLGYVMVETDKDGSKVRGQYKLVSSAGIVLATQEFNGYQSIKVEMTGALAEQIATLMSTITRAINTQLGLGE